jgi:adenylate cyclase
VPGGERLTYGEVAERSGVDQEHLRGFWRSLGLADAGPGDRVFTSDDVDAAKRMKQYFEVGLTTEMVNALGRVLGVAMAQVTAAARELAVTAFTTEDAAEGENAARMGEFAAAIAPQMGEILDYVFRLQLREQLRRNAIAMSPAPGAATEITVCFADLVGFTKLGEGVRASDLALVTGRLSELASEVIQPPVRIVKHLGDAVMIVGDDAEAVVDAALRLVDAADSEPEGFPALSAGIARGEAISQAGDWFGRPVNLASRLAGRARPSSVLVDESVKDASGEHAFEWSFAGSKSLKGIPAPVATYRVRRPEPVLEA